MKSAVEPSRTYPCISRSEALWQRAERVIPAGTQTLAKGPTQWVRGLAPKYLQRGKGSHVWDVDGNEYIDLTMGLGPISLGYGYPAVDNAIRSQLESGITFTLMHPLEVEVAELVSSVIPGVEMVRFSKTGCDVTSAAIRLARAYTNRSHVLCCGYHGWHDWYVSVTDRAAGIPSEVAELTHTFEFNDLPTLVDAIDNDVAAVILEPTVFERPNPDFLQGVRRACDACGAVLIFDEMWTGFRLALGGAQEYFCINADLSCFSKAVANGMPLSVLAGRREIMSLLENDVFFFTTFGGEALSLAAAKATITEMIERPVLQTIADQGAKLREGYNCIAAGLGMTYTSCEGYDARSCVRFDERLVPALLAKSFVQQEMLKHGVLWSGFHNLSYSHSNADIDDVLCAYWEILPRLREHVKQASLADSIQGGPILPSFRKTANFHTRRRSSRERIA